MLFLMTNGCFDTFKVDVNFMSKLRSYVDELELGHDS